MMRCPDCGWKPMQYREIWRGHYIVFKAEVDGTVDPEKDGELEKAGDPYQVQALCGKCPRIWTLRGIYQITELYPNAQSPRSRRR